MTVRFDCSRFLRVPLHSEIDVPRYTLESLIVILILFWLLGAFIYPFGGELIHLLLVVALVIVVVRVFEGRKAL